MKKILWLIPIIAMYGLVFQLTTIVGGKANSPALPVKPPVLATTSVIIIPRVGQGSGNIIQLSKGDTR